MPFAAAAIAVACENETLNQLNALSVQRENYADNSLSFRDGEMPRRKIKHRNEWSSYGSRRISFVVILYCKEKH